MDDASSHSLRVTSHPVLHSITSRIETQRILSINYHASCTFWSPGSTIIVLPAQLLHASPLNLVSANPRYKNITSVAPWLTPIIGRRAFQRLSIKNLTHTNITVGTKGTRKSSAECPLLLFNEHSICGSQNTVGAHRWCMNICVTAIFRTKYFMIRNMMYICIWSILCLPLLRR